MCDFLHNVKWEFMCKLAVSFFVSPPVKCLCYRFSRKTVWMLETKAFSFKHKSESINKKQRSQYLKLLEIKRDFEYTDLLSHRLKMCVQNSRNTMMLLDSVMIINLLFNFFLLHFNKTCFGIFTFESRKCFYKDNVKQIGLDNVKKCERWCVRHKLWILNVFMKKDFCIKIEFIRKYLEIY